MTATVTLIKKHRCYDAVTLMTLECGLFLWGYYDVLLDLVEDHGQ